MKILHVHGHALRWPRPAEAADHLDGGVETYLAGVLAAQESNGARVTVIRCCPEPDPHATRPGQFHEVRMAGHRFRRDADADFRRILAAVAPDVVHLHSAYGSVHPRTLEWLLRSHAVVQTWHDVNPLCFRRTRLDRAGNCCERTVGLRCLTSGCFRPAQQSGWLRGMADLLDNPRQLAALRRVPAVIAPSGYLRTLLLCNGFDGARIHVLPHYARFAADGPRRGPTRSGPTRLLYAGRFTADKGVFVLVEALAALSGRAWELALAGRGPQEPALRDRLCQAGLAHRVRFAGHLDGAALRREYEQADIVLMPSLQPETFGLAGLEALALGRPVVGFAAGGMSEWLIHERTGLVAAHGSAAALAGSLDRLLDDATLRERLGVTGQNLVQQRFRLEQHLEGLTNLYRAQVRARGGLEHATGRLATPDGVVDRLRPHPSQL